MAQTFIAESSNERHASFLTSYARKYKVTKIPVPMAAVQGYDAVYILVYSLIGIRDGKLTGPAVKTAPENISRTYSGVVATYERPFSLQSKDSMSQNMLVMGMVKNGAVTSAYPEDAKRILFVQRKQWWRIYLVAISVSRSVCALLASNGPSTRASTSP